MNSARDLTSRLVELLRREHGAMADFLVALADFDAKRRWVELGHRSLFDFLRRELGLSGGAASQRKTAAELVRRYPEVVEPLRDGRLCFSTVYEVSNVITPENRGEVLPRFFHLSRREAMAVSAELRPCEAPPQRTVVTPVRAPPVAPALALSAPRSEARVLPDELNLSPPATAAPAHPASPPSPPAPARPQPAEVVPLDAEQRRLHVTVSRRFVEKLEAVRAALSHSPPVPP